MPISKYYGGHGEDVAASMKKKYGEDWERVFYATANKYDRNPKSPKSPRKRKRYGE